jgi:hypothetical protein
MNENERRGRLTGGGGRLLDGDLLAEDVGDLPHLYIYTSLFWRRESTPRVCFQGWKREDAAGGGGRLLGGDPLVEDPSR